MYSENGFRFFFYSNDHLPIHIHVEKSRKTAKFLLEPVELSSSRNFKASESREIRIIINSKIEFFKEKWNEYFN
ncbi:DUF4160 domain-containing protein [Algoriphagus iocasae]|uniref:DUF4160 domain-containing protein n=1 Tax=Algoriphagus iocasae TaxID=1836499 RepID=UPI00160A08C0|nr:DUF4160 domain-containing protein [Algoriphagus iocasae]